MIPGDKVPLALEALASVVTDQGNDVDALFELCNLVPGLEAVLRGQAVICPREPTPEMILAACLADGCADGTKDCYSDCACGPYAKQYKEMLENSPYYPKGPSILPEK